MRVLLAIVVVCLLSAGRAAVAEPANGKAAKANALFEEGQKLVDANKIDLACEKFQASLTLDPQPGTRLNLADCRERQGRLVVAYRLFVEAAEESERADRASRVKFARQHLEAIAAKLVTVTLHVSEPDVAGLAITVAGEPVTRAQWDKPQFVMPGTFVVDVTAPGRVANHSDHTGAGGEQVVVEIPTLAPAAPTAPPPPPPAADVPSTTHRRQTLPLVIAGTGGALVIGSVVLALHARTRYNHERDLPGPDLNARLDGPQREADVATVLAITGTVAVAAGVVLFVRGRRADRVVVAPMASSSTLGLTIGGSL